jgi:hypothetical protein
MSVFEMVNISWIRDAPNYSAFPDVSCTQEELNKPGLKEFLEPDNDSILASDPSDFKPYRWDSDKGTLNSGHNLDAEGFQDSGTESTGYSHPDDPVARPDPSEELHHPQEDLDQLASLLTSSVPPRTELPPFDEVEFATAYNSGAEGTAGPSTPRLDWIAPFATEGLEQYSIIFGIDPGLGSVDRYAPSFERDKSHDEPATPANTAPSGWGTSPSFSSVTTPPFPQGEQADLPLSFADMGTVITPEKRKRTSSSSQEFIELVTSP